MKFLGLLLSYFNAIQDLFKSAFKRKIIILSVSIRISSCLTESDYHISKIPHPSETTLAPRADGMPESSHKSPQHSDNDDMSVRHLNGDMRNFHFPAINQLSLNGTQKKVFKPASTGYEQPASFNTEELEEEGDANVEPVPKDDRLTFAYGNPANDLIEPASDFIEPSTGFTSRLQEKVIAIYDVVFRANLPDNSSVRFNLGPAGIHLGQTITITRYSNKHHTKDFYRAHFHFPIYKSGNLIDVKQNFDVVFDCQVLDPEKKLFGEFKLRKWCDNVEIQCRDVNNVILNMMWKIDDDNGYPFLQWQLRSGYVSEEDHGILGWAKVRHGVDPNGPPAVLTGKEKKRIDALQNVQGIHWLNPITFSSALKEYIRVDVGGYPERDETESSKPEFCGSHFANVMVNY